MTTTTRPAHVPAPIAKVEGDIEVMQYDHAVREGTTTIQQLARWYERRDYFTTASKPRFIIHCQNMITALETELMDWYAAEALIAQVQPAPIAEAAQAAPVVTAAPIDETGDDYNVGYADATFGVARRNERGVRYQFGYDDGVKDADALDQRPDIVRRLADAGLSLNSMRPTQTEQDVIMALIDAADEIIRLRAELAVALRSLRATDEAFAGYVNAAQS